MGLVLCTKWSLRASLKECLTYKYLNPPVLGFALGHEFKIEGFTVTLGLNYYFVPRYPFATQFASDPVGSVQRNAKIYQLVLGIIHVTRTLAGMPYYIYHFAVVFGLIGQFPQYLFSLAAKPRGAMVKSYQCRSARQAAHSFIAHLR